MQNLFLIHGADVVHMEYPAPLISRVVPNKYTNWIKVEELSSVDVKDIIRRYVNKLLISTMGPTVGAQFRKLMQERENRENLFASPIGVELNERIEMIYAIITEGHIFTVGEIMCFLDEIVVASNTRIPASMYARKFDDARIENVIAQAIQHVLAMLDVDHIITNHHKTYYSPY